MSITSKPVQDPLPSFITSFSPVNPDMATHRGLNIIFAPFAAAAIFSGI